MLLIFLLHLAHFLFQLFDLLDGRGLFITFGRFHIGALLGRLGPEQRLGMRAYSTNTWTVIPGIFQGSCPKNFFMS